MRGWVVLSVTLLIGIGLGAALVARGPAIVAPYLPRSMNLPGTRIEGQVVRKQRDGNRLLVKVATSQGPMLVAFTEKVADLDVLLDPGDTVALVTTGYATFVNDPILERVRRPDGSSQPSPPSPGSPQGPTR
jgi:hypothetical protein